MITISGKKTLGANGKFVVRANQPQTKANVTATLARKLPTKETASYGGAGLPPSNIRSFAKPTSVPIGAGLIPESPELLCQLAREIFTEDPLSGSVVDIMSLIPFGEFALSGIPSDYLKPYEKSLERMRIKSLFPAAASSFLCDGAVLGSLIYNEEEKLFDGFVPQDLANATLTPVPFFGASPLVDMRISTEVARALGNQDPRMQRYLRHLPKEMQRGGLVKLQPESTMYIPRRTRLDVPIGTSLFRRIMPVYILEKALLRGTIEMAYRRQRGIIHILVGDENWDASNEELQAVSDLFQSADLDPYGAVIATRTGIQPTEVSGAGDFWRWTDNVDVIAQVKLKGLGMPDGLLGGDMSLDSVGQTMTVFMQQVRSFRDYLTRCMLYEKIFAYLAVTNNHKKDNQFVLTGGFDPNNSLLMRRALNDALMSYAADSDVEMGNYMVPTLTWHNQMRPEGDEAYMALLDNLAAAGVPIPIRMKVAAAGINIDDILNGADDDIKLQIRIQDYKQTLAQYVENPTGENAQEVDNAYAAFKDPHRALSPLPRTNLLNREFDERLQPRNIINGHEYLATAEFKKQFNERENRKIAKAGSSISYKVNRLMQSETIHYTDQRQLGGIYGV